MIEVHWAVLVLIAIVVAAFAIVAGFYLGWNEGADCSLGVKRAACERRSS